MTEHDSEHILEKVRKLLAKAESTPSEHERDAFNAKAAELIAKYGIAMAMLAAAEAPARKEEVSDRMVRIASPYAKEKSALLHNVSEPLGVRTIRTSGRSAADGVVVQMYGFPSDLERVDLLFTSLLVQVSLGLAVSRSSRRGESAVAYRKSWVWGFIEAVRRRLLLAEKAAKREMDDRGGGISTDLVLADRAALVEARLAEDHPHREGGRTFKIRGSGYRDGQAAGERAHLGGGGINAARRNSIDR